MATEGVIDYLSRVRWHGRAHSYNSCLFLRFQSLAGEDLFNIKLALAHPQMAMLPHRAELAAHDKLKAAFFIAVRGISGRQSARCPPYFLCAVRLEPTDLKSRGVLSRISHGLPPSAKRCHALSNPCSRKIFQLKPGNLGSINHFVKRSGSLASTEPGTTKYWTGSLGPLRTTKT